MTTKSLEEILQKGEGIDIEFKTSQFELNRDTFESICALLNRKGSHRELASAFPAKFIIEGDKVVTENWNRPHDGGIINPANFSPYPKNPVIANFFKEIGHVDELGSGVRNTYKYCGKYTQGASPQFIDDEIFKIIIPLNYGRITGESSEEVRR